MGNNNKNVIPFDRNRSQGPWQPLQPMPITPEGAAQGILAAFRNNRYSVAIKQTSSSGFLMQGPDGRATAAPIAHLIINRLDGKKPEWAHLQRIKNELIHENAEAVEIFPGEDRRIDIAQTMLWCLPPGMRFPVGLYPAAAIPKPEDEVVPGVIRRADLQFYVIETPQGEGEPPVVEVFADDQDARACYEKTGAAFPETGALRMLGGVPQEEEGAAWSTNAQVRRQELQDRIAEAGAKMAAEQAALRGRAILPNGPPTYEEELEAAGAFAAEGGLIDGPMEEAEAERLEQLMREGMQRHAAERDAKIAAEIDARKDAGEVAAAESLEEMRRQLVQSGKIEGPPAARPDGEDKPN